MVQYTALDVSDKDTANHVLDEQGKLVWKGKRASEPEVLATALRRYAPELQRVGLETGQLTPWLCPLAQGARGSGDVPRCPAGSGRDGPAAE